MLMHLQKILVQLNYIFLGEAGHEPKNDVKCCNFYDGKKYGTNDSRYVRGVMCLCVVPVSLTIPLTGRQEFLVIRSI